MSEIKTIKYEPIEIRAFPGHPEKYGIIPVTILYGRYLRAGTLLQQTESKKYMKYQEGEGTAIGILAHDVDPSEGDAQAVMYYKGDFIKANLIGYDIAAAEALKAREIGTFVHVP